MIEAIEADELRARLVNQLITTGRIRDPRIADAFRAVPRHLFVPGRALEQVYEDEAIVTRRGPDGRPTSSSSQPAIMAAMLEQLDLRADQRVLEIGAGTGYNAALMAHLVGDGGAVVTVDIDEDLVEQAGRQLRTAGLGRVSVVCADGTAGWPVGAPYDRIVVTASAADVAPAWTAQLADGGRLLLPLSLRGVQQVVAFERRGDHLASVSVVNGGFMPMRGDIAGPDRVHPLGDQPGLLLEVPDDAKLDFDALYAALGRPGPDLATGVRLAPAEAFGGLGLWLALHEPAAGRLIALDAAVERGLVPPLVAFPGMAATAVLLDGRALAALVRLDDQAADSDARRLDDQAADPDARHLGVRPLGAGAELAQRLLGRVHQWAARGRPSTSSLRIRAYPQAAATPDDAAVVIETPHRRLLVDW